MDVEQTQKQICLPLEKYFYILNYPRVIFQVESLSATTPGLNNVQMLLTLCYCQTYILMAMSF